MSRSHAMPCCAATGRRQLPVPGALGILGTSLAE
jgi:hypothetical protein